MLKQTVTILSLALAGGCAAEAGDEPLPPSHPASPRAAEGRPHEASGVLSVSEGQSAGCGHDAAQEQSHGH